MIVTTSKLLLAQVQMLLDKSLMENDHFSPHLDKINLNELVKETVNVLQGQASMN